MDRPNAMGETGARVHAAIVCLRRLPRPDAAELLRVRAELEDLILEGRLIDRAAAQAPVAGAARRIGDALELDDAAAQATLREAASLLAEAVLVLDAPAAPGGPEPLPLAPDPELLGDDAVGTADAWLLHDFVAESRECMQRAEAALLALELNPDDAEALDTVFRGLHTIKGLASFLELAPIADLAHHAESLLDRFRRGELRCTGQSAELAVRVLDLLGSLVDSAEDLAPDRTLRVPRAYDSLLRTLMDPLAGGATRVAGEQDDEASASASPQTAPPAGRSAAGSAATVRVRLDRLDRLMDLVEELASIHAALARHPAVAGEPGGALAAEVARAGSAVRQLHEVNASMRMVPLWPTLQKMSRLVRDLARGCGKQVDFVGEGGHLEVDRDVVEVIGGPLVHMIRNAVDHGIETPAEREARGKPRAGVVRLSAHRSHGHVLVRLQDDGRGIDLEAVRTRALWDARLAGAAPVTDAQLLDLIFLPGFSTAGQLTGISGRGVGMDVVRRSVEAVGGWVQVASEPGHGTTFTLHLPLSLEVSDGRVVRRCAEGDPACRCGAGTPEASCGEHRVEDRVAVPA